MTDHQHYTLSMAMTKSGKFLFVDKTHGPMTGSLIFPGGKVEPGEEVEDANVREFLEETGIETSIHEWVELATINYPTYTLHCMLLASRTLRDSLIRDKTDTGEKIVLVDITKDETGRVDRLCELLLTEIVYKL